MLVQPQGILNVSERFFTYLQGEQAIQAQNTAGMPASDRCHLDNLPLDELNSIVFRQNPSLTHLVVLVHRKEAFGCLKGHETFPSCRVRRMTHRIIP